MGISAKLLISSPKIQKRVRELACKIEKNYQDKKPVLIGVLKGAFIFMADLIRSFKTPAEFDFITIASYDDKKSSPGKVKLLKDISISIKNRNVLIVEDIIDTGISADFIINYLKQKSPKSIRFCALLNKQERRKVPVRIDYCGFKVPDKFIVGYGLDYDEQYRNLPYVGYIETKKSEML